MMPFSLNRLSFDVIVETVMNSWSDILATVITSGMRNEMGAPCYNSPLDLSSIPTLFNCAILIAIYLLLRYHWIVMTPLSK